MKQIIQNYKTGELQIVEVPAPASKKGFVLAQNVSSLLSIGTEKNMIEMAKKSLLGKALERPDLAKQVIAKAKAEGIIEARKAAMARLDNPVPLGYSCAGVVINVAEGVQEFKKGDMVACAGSGYASHAELVCVPQNLCVKIPESVDFESASFVALGGIALQAVRMANPSLGERVAVIGLGLLGQITVQLLKAVGCHIFGIDISEEKIKMAIENGAEEGAVSGKVDVFNATREFAPNGFDSVIIMASSKSNEPLELAAKIARERAKIVATGLVGLNIPRKIFFEKELEFVVSRAWGPGVFDPFYTEKNIDNSYAYVRWTAKRNMEEFLYQISNGSVKVKHLITHRFPIEKALEAYDLILKGKEPYLSVLITYPDSEKIISQETPKSIFIVPKTQEHKKLDKHVETLKVGFIGAGLFATGTLLPILKSFKKVRLKGVATATGIKAQHTAKKFGFEYFTTDYKELLKDDEIDLIFILTRHGSHAHFVIEALKAGKNVFVEKPLCINEEQLKEITSVCTEINSPDAMKSAGALSLKTQVLMVGFNRRFSTFSIWLKERFKVINEEPISIHCTVNSGYVPPENWIHDPEDGGGRIIGEVCHFVDLVQFFTDSLPVRVIAETINSNSYMPSDNVSITLKMKNGSICSILYVTSGDKRYPRERVEIFGGGAVGIIENFKKATFVYKGNKKKIENWLSLDRGHKKEIEILISSIMNNQLTPVPFEEYIYTTLTTFAIEESLRACLPMEVDSHYQFMEK